MLEIGQKKQLEIFLLLLSKPDVHADDGCKACVINTVMDTKSGTPQWIFKIAINAQIEV